MKKFLALILAAAFTFSMVACNSAKTEEKKDDTTAKTEDTAKDTAKTGNTAKVSADNIKVGFIFIGDENENYT